MPSLTRGAILHMGFKTPPDTYVRWKIARMFDFHFTQRIVLHLLVPSLDETWTFHDHALAWAMFASCTRWYLLFSQRFPIFLLWFNGIINLALFNSPHSVILWSLFTEQLESESRWWKDCPNHRGSSIHVRKNSGCNLQLCLGSGRCNRVVKKIQIHFLSNSRVTAFEQCSSVGVLTKQGCERKTRELWVKPSK